MLLHGAYGVDLSLALRSCWFDFTGLGKSRSSLQFTEMSQIREQSCAAVAYLPCMDKFLGGVSSADRAALS